MCNYRYKCVTFKIIITVVNVCLDYLFNILFISVNKSIELYIKLNLFLGIVRIFFFWTLSFEGKIKELFWLENASNLPPYLCMKILLTTTFLKKTHVSNLLNFQDEMVYLFLLQKKAFKSKNFYLIIFVF